jgi:two-component system, LytTR family, sensor kinase
MKDKWLLILGIPFVGFVMPLVFNEFSIDFLMSDGYRNLIMSTSTTIAIWLGIRKIVIVLWEKFPWEKKPLKHIILEIILVSSYTMFVGFINYLIYVHTNFVEFDEDLDIGISISITLLITFFITSLHEAWFFYKQWNISLVKAQMLEKENVISQYETLKSQINPHFLFNTLNTLTILIEESPRVAVGYVEKTSDFLRSILSMKDREIISVQDEIRIIETFYQLQKERFGDNLHLDIQLSAGCLSKNLPPLSVQMLIENAIKHNVVSSENPLSISIASTPNDEFLVIRNNLQPKTQPNPSSGIGLQNIKNRYSFLSNQAIEINETTDEFVVKLPLLKNI